MPSWQCKSTQKMLSNDTHVVLLPKKAMGHNTIMTMQTYSKNAFQRYPYCIFTKKGNGTWHHHHHVKVLKKCFPMIPILYYYQKRQWDMITFECYIPHYLFIICSHHILTIEMCWKNDAEWGTYCMNLYLFVVVWLSHSWMDVSEICKTC